MECREAETRPSCHYPITFIDRGKLHGIPAPLARIRTCGLIEIEVLKEVVSMELLGKHERFGEVEAYYQQCLTALDELEHGKQPDQRTQDLREFLRVKQLRREPKMADQYTVLPSTPAMLSNGQRAILPTTSELLMSNVLALPAALTHQGKPMEMVIADSAACFGTKLAQITTLIHQWYGMARFCNILQDRLDQEIKQVDLLKLQHPLEEWTLLRQGLLMALATLPCALLASVKQGQKLILVLEEVLPQCAASITACVHLSGGGNLREISAILDSYLPTLIAITDNAPAYREVAADLVAQCYFLKTILSWHLESLLTAETSCLQALNYSTIAKNPNLRLTALNQHALIFYYSKHFQKALAKSEEASTLFDQSSHEHTYPIVQGRVSMYLAAMQAQQKLPVEAERTLERVHTAFALQVASAEPVPLYADCGTMSLTLWDGLTHYYLGQHDATHTQRALDSLRRFGQLQPGDAIPERFRLECLNNRTLAAAQLNEMEEAIACIEAGKQGARELESKQRSGEVAYAHQELFNRWPTETRVHMVGNSPDGDTQ